MKRFLFLFSLIFMGYQGLNAQTHTEFSDTTCSAGAGVTNTITINQPLFPSTDVKLTFWAQGDLNATTEFVDIFSENGGLIGRTNLNPIQCGSYDSTIFIVPIDSFAAWAADGVITFDGFFSAATGFCAPDECLAVVAEYLPVTGPNDAGVTGSASLQAICPGSNPVVVTVQNFGTNQITSLNIDWEMDGIAQPGVTFNGTLDTLGGSGSSSAQVTLGNFTFNVAQTYALRAWTSLPNGVVDTTNINDTLSTNLALVNAPSGLAVSGILTNSANILWNTAAGTNYDIIYGPNGFDPAISGTVVPNISTGSPYNLTGLMPSTGYDIYVRANCGAGALSGLAGPVFFFTNCSISTAPFSENFDDPTWVASGNNNGNQINPCWSSTPDVASTLAFKWIPRSTGPTSGNGPLSDLTGGNFVYAEASGATAGQLAFLTSPLIDVSNLTTPALYFFQHRNANGGNLADMDVEVSSDFGATWTSEYNVTGEIQSGNGDPWELTFVNLGNYTGDTIQIRFLQTSAGCCGDAAIDSVVVDEAPTCPWPTQVAVTGLSDTSVTVSWADPSGTSWDVEWGPCGYSQGTGSFVTTSSNPFTGTGLLPNTCYDLYVRANCSAAGNGNSIWIGPVSFNTQCTGFTAPYFANFDGTSAPALDNCWTEVEQGNANSEVGTDAFRNFSPPNSLEIHNSNSLSGTVAAVSPRFDDLDNTKQISMFLYDEDGSFDGSDLIIGTMTDPLNTSTFTPYDTITEAEMDDDVWEFFVVQFDNYTGTDKYIAFVHGMNSTFDNIHIDDFRYDFIPSCNPPLITTVGVSGVGVTTAIATWGSGSDGDETHIEWGTPGFVPGTLSYIGLDSVAGSVDQYQMTGLSPQTSYEFYIADSCAGGSFSPWVGPISFITQCNVLSAPLIEDFDGTSWVASGNNAGNQLDPCWSSDPDVSLGTEPFKWIPRSTGPTSGNGPLNDLTGGNFMYVEASGSTNGDTAYLYSPLIDVSSLTAPALYFWQHRWPGSAAGTIATMDVEVSNDFGATWTNVYNITGSLQTLTAGPWEDEIVNLPQFVGDTIQIRWAQNGLGCCGDAAIDSVAIAEAPACPDPSLFGLSSLLDTSASFGWVGPVGATGYEIWYGPQGFYQGTQTVGGTKTIIPGSTFTWAPLTPQTCYEILVRGICTGGDTSAWVGPLQFCTPCSAFSAPYFENFDAMATGSTPSCFEAILIGSTSGAIEVTNIGGARSAPNHVRMNNWTNTTTMMISPLFGDMAVGDKWVTFYAREAAAGGEQITVGTVSSPSDFTNFNALNTYTLSTVDQKFSTILSTANGYNGTDQFIAIRHGNGGILRDIYIDDFLYSVVPSGDLDVVDANFIRGECLSTNDSIFVDIFNSVSAVDFSVNSLDVFYDVTGPANSSGSLTVSSGLLPVNDTLRVLIGGIDLSQVGSYNLKAWIDTSVINQIPAQDTIDGVSVDVRPEFQVNPKTVTLTSLNDSVDICVESSFFGGGEFLITEQCQFRTTNGAPAGGWPAYLVADDYIEITGVPNADLGGITLEQYNATALAGTYTFPPGTFLSPNGTAIIAVGQLNASAPDPSNFYYHGNGTYTGLWSSSTASGRLLKDANGTIIDAVINNAFTWPAVAGVTAADWSGTVPGTGGSAGNRLEGPDLNNGTGWIASATSSQNPGTVNANVPAPKSAGAPGLQWTLNGTVVDTLPCIQVGPYTSTGVYQYIVTYSNNCGSFTDTVTVIVPNCSAPSNLVGTSTGPNSISLTWDTVGTGATTFDVEYGGAGFMLGSGTRTSVTGNSTALTGLANNLCQEFYIRSSCSATDSSAWVGPVSVCPDLTLCTDDFDQYATGAFVDQSSLFIGWQGGAPGDGTISTNQASSGSQSVRITDKGPAGATDIVAFFPPISAGAWEITWDMYVGSNDGAYYNIQQNHVIGGVGNLWNAELYFQPTGVCQIQHSAAATVIGTFTYPQGAWTTMKTVIDFPNDTIWFEIGGASTGLGFDYSVVNPTAVQQFNGINFYSGALAPQVYPIDYYVDNFCVQPYVTSSCAAPTSLNTANLTCTSTDLTFSSNTGASSSWIEYGPAGFAPLTGAGTIVWSASPYSLTGLTAGTGYDFYVADTCGTDTSAVAGPFSFTTPTGPLQADFTHTLGAAGPNNRNVFFDGTTSQGATSYAWDFDDGNTGTGATTSHIYGANGDYNVTLTITGPCGTDTFSDTVRVREISLSDYALANSLVVYPVPTKGVFNISFETDGSDDVEIKLMDLSGKVIMSRALNNLTGKFEDDFDISSFADGTYLLSINSGDGVVIRRIIKE